MSDIPKKAIEAAQKALMERGWAMTDHELAHVLSAALPHLASAQQPNDDVWWWMRAPIDRLRIRAKDDHDLLKLIDAYDQSFKKAASVRVAALDECEAMLRGMADDCNRIGNKRREDAFGHAADAIAALKRGPV